MNELVIEVLKSSPQAAAILITVFAFLKAMSKRDKDYNESRDRHVSTNREQMQYWATALRDITTQNIAALKDCAATMGAMKESWDAKMKEKEL